MGLLRKLLYGNDYDALMSQYEILKKDYERYQLVFPYIDEACKRNFRERDKTYYEFHELHHTYRDVVMVIMVNNLAEPIIITGQFHVWRGMLNPIGSDALQLFHLLVDALEKSGYYMKEKAKEDRDWIRKMIQEAG